MEVARLIHFLTALRCPPFLQTTEEGLQSAQFRRTLLLWLYAIYQQPTLRLEDDERWTREEPQATLLMQWLYALGVGTEAECKLLLDGDIALKTAVSQLLLVVEMVHGRCQVADDDHAVDATHDLIADIALNQESIFDERCELFPLSIQMLLREMHDHHEPIGNNSFPGFKRDMEALQQQVEAIDARIATAQDRLHALDTEPEDSASTQSENSQMLLSMELGKCLGDCVPLLGRATTMIRDEIAGWLQPPRPQLIGLGQTAAALYHSVDQLVQFLQNAQSFAAFNTSPQHLASAQDVTDYCNHLVQRIAPSLQAQRTALANALQSNSPLTSV